MEQRIQEIKLESKELQEESKTKKVMLLAKSEIIYIKIPNPISATNFDSM